MKPSDEDRVKTGQDCTSTIETQLHLTMTVIATTEACGISKLGEGG